MEAPIQNLDVFDVVGVRKDGGIDLRIVTRGPLDESQATLALLEQKIRNYLTEIGSAVHHAKFGAPAEHRTRIILSGRHPVSAAALQLIKSLAPLASQHGAELEIEPPF